MSALVQGVLLASSDSSQPGKTEVFTQGGNPQHAWIDERSGTNSGNPEGFSGIFFPWVVPRVLRAADLMKSLITRGTVFGQTFQKTLST